MLSSVELFAGVGGLALGVSNAGFHHKAVVEWNPDACETIRANQRLGMQPMTQWPLYQGDVRAFDFDAIEPNLDLLAAGVPCQPWSLGGKHRGFQDERNLFPDTIAAIRKLQPKAILIENVKGLLRESFSKYFEYITLMVRHPELIRKESESWMEHLSRLERHHTSGRYRGLEYKVIFRLLNAADYGVPQRRERVFIMAFRSDLAIEGSFPDSTHSQESLWVDQWVTGEYWDRHKVGKKYRPAIPANLEKRLDRLKSLLPLSMPWMTVRDSLQGLPEPENSHRVQIGNHTYQPGAKPYPGHTGSPLDEPAKTLKAGDHGVPGGENMLRLPDGTVRYFTVRESARIQTFPDHFVFHGAWSEMMRQLGNAVPVQLAKVVASSIGDRLQENRKRHHGSPCEQKRLITH